MMRTVRVRRALLQGWPRAAVSFGRAVSQSAQLLLYPSNRFAWRADQVSTGAKGGAPRRTPQRARSPCPPRTSGPGAYTLQFFNASKSFGTSSGTLTFSNGITACGASPVTGNTIN